MITDKTIQQFIDSVPQTYILNDYEQEYISHYSAKDLIPDSVFNKLKEVICERLPDIKKSEMLRDYKRITALAADYVSDQILFDTNINVTSFQNEYYKYRIAWAINQKKWLDGHYVPYFRDLADYFINYRGNNTKYNLVVVVPDYTEYNRIDSNKNFAILDSRIYYILRGTYFGHLFSVIQNQFLPLLDEYKNLIGKEPKLTAIGDWSILEIV